jgi:hypothetical protein
MLGGGAPVGASSPHDVLGVSVDAGATQIRRAYKRLARRYHPDRNADAGATARFVEAKAARDEMLRRLEAGEAPRARSPRPQRRPADPTPTPRPHTVRPPPHQVRPQPQAPPDGWQDEDLRVALTDLWRPALYLSAVGVLLVALWGFIHMMEQVATIFGPGVVRPPVAEATDEAGSE